MIRECGQYPGEISGYEDSTHIILYFFLYIRSDRDGTALATSLGFETSHRDKRQFNFRFVRVFISPFNQTTEKLIS